MHKRHTHSVFSTALPPPIGPPACDKSVSTFSERGAIRAADAL